MKKFSIRLNTVEKIKRFIEIVISFKSDINLIKKTYVVDAKSILAVYALVDASEEFDVEIVSNDAEEIQLFNYKMKEFRA